MIEITCVGTFEPTHIEGDIRDLLKSLNDAAKQNHPFVLVTDITGAPVLIDLRNIVRAREVQDDLV